jgi:hypothetical protein
MSFVAYSLIIRPDDKINKHWGCSLVVEHLPSMLALGLIWSTTKIHTYIQNIYISILQEKNGLISSTNSEIWEGEELYDLKET